MANIIKIVPPIIAVISYFPFNNFSILCPKNNPIKEIMKVITIIIET